MNLLYLGEQDFFIDKGNKGPVVCTTQKGICFVFFHADPGFCKFCDLAKPEFLQLPQYIAGAKFALCNMSKAKNLMDRSLATVSPLNKVPVFILFVNGRPFLNYTGEKQLKHFSEFMQNVMQRLQNQQVFGAAGMGNAPVSLSAEEMEKTPHGIPYDYDYESVSDASTMGGIVCDDKGCYLTHKDAFGASEPAGGAAPSPQQQQPQYQQQAAMQGGRQAMNQVMQQSPQSMNPAFALPQQPQPQQQYFQQPAATYRPPQQQQPYYPPQQYQVSQAYFQQPPQMMQQQQAYRPPQQQQQMMYTPPPQPTQMYQQQMYQAQQQQQYYPQQQQVYRPPTQGYQR